MSIQVTNYQCPACTGPLQFDADTGKLGCEYCGSSYSTAEIEALYAEKDLAAEKVAEKPETQWDTSVLNSDWGDEGAAMRVYSCPSCCAELICDENTAATSCPYCGNPILLQEFLQKYPNL